MAPIHRLLQSNCPEWMIIISGNHSSCIFPIGARVIHPFFHIQETLISFSQPKSHRDPVPRTRNPVVIGPLEGSIVCQHQRFRCWHTDLRTTPHPPFELHLSIGTIGPTFSCSTMYLCRALRGLCFRHDWSVAPCGLPRLISNMVARDPAASVMGRSAAIAFLHNDWFATLFRCSLSRRIQHLSYRAVSVVEQHTPQVMFISTLTVWINSPNISCLTIFSCFRDIPRAQTFLQHHNGNAWFLHVTRT